MTPDPDVATPATPAPEVLPATRPPDKIPVRVGVILGTIDEVWRMAQNLAAAGMVPKDYRGQPANVLAAIQLGAELNIPPMHALQSICVINGRPTLYGDGLLAVIMASPLYQTHQEFYDVAGLRRDHLDPADLGNDDTAAVCCVWRKGGHEPTTRRFSIAQAKRAGLWGKDAWQQYPDRLLRMRARSWALRDTFPDLLRGLRAAEEAIDEPAEATEPARVPRLSDAAPARDLHDFSDRTADTRHDDPAAPADTRLDDTAF